MTLGGGVPNPKINGSVLCIVQIFKLHNTYFDGSVEMSAVVLRSMVQGDAELVLSIINVKTHNFKLILLTVTLLFCLHKQFLNFIVNHFRYFC